MSISKHLVFSFGTSVQMVDSQEGYLSLNFDDHGLVTSRFFVLSITYGEYMNLFQLVHYSHLGFASFTFSCRVLFI